MTEGKLEQTEKCRCEHNEAGFQKLCSFCFKVMSDYDECLKSMASEAIEGD